mmetsp:Transcript_58980/g.70984  ORF Transcript_58980/g.70984 Transcript_58980/m.70984 type:complete len:224 (+) Transcript_58980:17-688(+)
MAYVFLSPPVQSVEILSIIQTSFLHFEKRPEYVSAENSLPLKAANSGCNLVCVLLLYTSTVTPATPLCNAPKTAPANSSLDNPPPTVSPWFISKSIAPSVVFPVIRGPGRMITYLPFPLPIISLTLSSPMRLASIILSKFPPIEFVTLKLLESGLSIAREDITIKLVPYFLATIAAFAAPSWSISNAVPPLLLADAANTILVAPISLIALSTLAWSRTSTGGA